ncbi:O-methyltransferase [Naasia sp. SYSU D00948]|uniref:O-methyltransferase n=1 Tax=Naasia sp. SYSU D00948 TaxID=2817379 RepID=UPI001B3142E2|nr:class I SAM-dependent methyltransferase [Naasia sp. SYSU D00948]
MASSWADVDRFLEGVLDVHDTVLDEVLAANRAAALPAIDVSPLQGRLLMLLARLSGARRVLEVGTLGGYSTVWLARGLPEEGRIVTLELSPRHAEVAAANVAGAGFADRVEIRVGPALDSLARLREEGGDPFDLVFLDADKPNNPRYIEAALALCRPGSVLVVDNVVRGGGVVDGADPASAGSREALQVLGGHPRLDATALQTVGSKGWDGFAVAVVR